MMEELLYYYVHLCQKESKLQLGAKKNGKVDVFQINILRVPLGYISI